MFQWWQGILYQWTRGIILPKKFLVVPKPTPFHPSVPTWRQSYANSNNHHGVEARCRPQFTPCTTRSRSRLIRQQDDHWRYSIYSCHKQERETNNRNQHNPIILPSPPTLTSTSHSSHSSWQRPSRSPTHQKAYLSCRISSTIRSFNRSNPSN